MNMDPENRRQSSSEETQDLHQEKTEQASSEETEVEEIPVIRSYVLVGLTSAITLCKTFLL